MSHNPSLSKPVVFIGAADVICAKAIEFFAAASEAPIVLVDVDEDAIRKATNALPVGRFTTRKANIFEPSELRRVILGARLVVVGAQPYFKTTKLVLEVCLEAKVPYLDYSDDVKSTQDSLELSQRAKDLNVPCFINCGASPGMTNLMAIDAAKQLDLVDTIDIGWYVTDQGGHNGKEVLEHLMHIAAGPCLTWADGKAAVHENWVETVYAPIAAGEADVLLHETVHPEPVTLPRAFPKANRIRCVGAINPVPFNGFARGLAIALRSGALSMNTAIEFLWNLAQNSKQQTGWRESVAAVGAHLRGGNATLNELGQLAWHTVGYLNPWRYALWGMIDQVRAGECSIMDVLGFLIDSARSRHAPYRSGMMVRVLGTRNGHPATVVRRRPKRGHEALGNSMAAEIGACCATFILMVLEEKTEHRAGVVCPEDWADPYVFYKTMERLGYRPEDIIESFPQKVVAN